MSEVIGKSGFSVYQSPIELIVDKVRMEQDEYVVRCVQKMGVNVDRDELIRALMYDRDQYEQGYADGRWARDSEIVRCKDCIHRDKYECNNITLGGTKCGVTDDWYCADGERREVSE